MKKLARRRCYEKSMGTECLLCTWQISLTLQKTCCATHTIQRKRCRRKVLQYITLRTGPVVVWVETIPSSQGREFSTRLQSPAPSLTQAEHEKFRRQHTRFNSKPCMMGCHLQRAPRKIYVSNFTCRPLGPH